MKTSQLLLGSIAAVILSCIATSSTSAAPRAACAVLSLAEVRAIVGAPVVAGPGSFAPATRGNSTYSNCTYLVMGANGHPAIGREAKITLMWGPKALLSQTNQFYIKRHKEAPGRHGDVLVLAWVGDPSSGAAGDWSASQKLLAAALAKL